MSPPGARLRAVMPRVGLTRGQPARRDARGEPHPPPTPGYIVNYINRPWEISLDETLSHLSFP